MTTARVKDVITTAATSAPVKSKPYEEKLYIFGKPALNNRYLKIDVTEIL